MRNKLIGLFCTAALLLGAGAMLSQQNAEDAKFSKFLESYMDEYWKFYPSAGTLAGYSKYNDKLEDMSEGAVEKRGTALDGFNKDLVTKFPPNRMSLDAQADRELLLDAIDLELFRLENLVPQQYNPLFYNEIILNSLRGLLEGDFNEAKLKSAIERARLLPGLIKTAKENLKTPPKEYTEAAIRQIPSILDYLKTAVPTLIEKGSAEGKAKFQAELTKAVAAVDDYARYLESDLLAKSTGNFRLGPEAHSKLIRLTGQHAVPIPELIERSKADLSNIRREMRIIAISVFRILYPDVDIEKIGNPDVAGHRMITGVLEKMNTRHIAKDQWQDKIKSDVAEIKAFLDKTNLLPAPEGDLALVPAPAYERGLSWLKLVGPAPYASTGGYSLQLPSIPADWPEDRVEQFLQEYNDFYMNFWVIERIFPGMFYPAALGQKSATLLRKVYPNRPLLAGWPLYTGEMFIYAGFGDYNVLYRFYQLKLQLKAVIDFQMDLNIHQSDTSKEKFVDYAMRYGYLTRAEAERKWDYIVLNPGASVYPYIGYQEILDMEKTERQIKGSSFTQKEFLKKLVSFGPLSLRHLKARMAQ